MTFTSGTVQVADAELLRKLTLYMFICVNSRHATYTLWLKQIAQQTRPENLLEEGHHTHSALINLHRAYHSDGLALQRVCIREPKYGILQQIGRNSRKTSLSASSLEIQSRRKCSSEQASFTVAHKVSGNVSNDKPVEVNREYESMVDGFFPQKII